MTKQRGITIKKTGWYNLKYTTKRKRLTLREIILNLFKKMI